MVLLYLDKTINNKFIKMLSLNLLRHRNKLAQAAVNVSAKWNQVTAQRFAWTAVELDRCPKELRANWPKPSFSIEKMTDILDHDNLEMRKEMREFLSDPVMIPKYNISLEEEREVSP